MNRALHIIRELAAGIAIRVDARPRMRYYPVNFDGAMKW